MSCCNVAIPDIKGCCDVIKTYLTVNIYQPEYIDIEIKGLLTKEQLDKSKLIKL